MKNNFAKIIAVNAVVASLYVVFSLPFMTLSTSQFVQFRPSEALAVLPALLPYTVAGLTIGCAISNVVSPFGLYDVILGSVITLVAGLLTATLCKKSYLAPLPAVVLNALLLPLVWLLAGGDGGITTYLLSAVGLLVSQTVVAYGLGLPLYFFTKNKIVPLLDK